MEHAPKIKDPLRVPLTIDVPPYLRDHCFQGQAILPAVESMQLLAASVSAWRPTIDIRWMIHAKFIKFLFIPPQETRINAFAELSAIGDGRIIVRLITRQGSPQSSLTRIKEHAAVEFHDGNDQNQEPGADDVFEEIVPDDTHLAVSAQTVYRELVPFGPCYQNLTGDLTLFRQGAAATIRSPDDPAGSLLGSSFVLDAAFHAACVWGQRYTDVVGFPVGFEKRTIFHPTQPGQIYHCRIVPLEISPGLIKFNIRIYQAPNTLFESVQGVDMRDVSGGKLRPPAWLNEGGR
jgi:hypothetical protein